MQWVRFGTLPGEVYQMTDGEVLAMTAFFDLYLEERNGDGV